MILLKTILPLIHTKVISNESRWILYSHGSVADPDPRIFSSRIPDPGFYVLCKRGVAKINIPVPVPCCLRFQEWVLRVAQFHEDNITRILKIM
jgi:hypothetical protein